MKRAVLLHQCLVFLTWLSAAWSFPIVPSSNGRPSAQLSIQLQYKSTITSLPSQSRSAPRTGILQSLLNLALNSPLWKNVLVPQARKKMEDKAAQNGIPWKECRAWIKSQNGPWNDESKVLLHNDHDIPDYYRQAFHAYDHGNLCWEAALEAEIASAAMGARNYPAYGRKGDNVLRDSFHAVLLENGAACPNAGVVIDLGCGTGISTRHLAKDFPQASKIIGIDLSPYFCQVGTALLGMAPIQSVEDGGPWVNAIDKDDRIQYQVGDAAKTGLPDASADVVLLQFVPHELPHLVTMEVFREAHRILRNGGQFWFCEMDFETPGFVAQRANPLLFSLIRSTEPYLDDYADHAQECRDYLQQLFASTIIAPATGRHFAIVATKDDSVEQKDHVLKDTRFDENGEYRIEDTHLTAFENKLSS